jgi:hypothetical protein
VQEAGGWRHWIAIGAPERQRRWFGRALTAGEQEQLEIDSLLGLMVDHGDGAEEEAAAPARPRTPAEIDGELFALIDAEMRLYDGEAKLASRRV